MYNAVIYIAKCVSAAEAARLPGFEECVLNDHHYSIGEKFHPVIDVNGTLYEAVCFNCTCLPVSFAREIIGARCACACAAPNLRARGEKLFTGEAKRVHTLHTSIKDSMGSIKVPLSNRLRHLAITSTAKNSAMMLAAVIFLIFSSQSQSAIAQCDQVICPPADCPNPIRFAGQCCDICIPPPSELRKTSSVTI